MTIHSWRTSTVIWLTVAFIAGILGLDTWFTHRDAQLKQAALAYERCVQREYGMTPIRWYEENGKYPLCGN